MRILFLVYHALAEYSGITKKIRAQVDGLRQCGADVRLCTLAFAADGSQSRVCEGSVLRAFGSGLKAKLTKRVSYSDILEYVEKEAIETVYIRYDINADPFTKKLVKGLKMRNIRVLVEIPTWPYDGEFKGQSLKLKAQLAVDKIFRRGFFRYCDRVVTYSDCSEIFGVKTVNISNGIDFDSVPLAAEAAADGRLKLLSVANIHLWHGLDRLIAGMGQHPEIPVELHIVGDGLQDIIEGYRSLAAQYGIADRISILGPLYGKALDEQFDWADMAVGSLARHRSGITDIKTLKNREYAARGLSFFYSENDSDFDGAPYILKVPADESPVDINALQQFHASMKIEPLKIRESIAGLSWKAQMKKILL